MTWEIHVISKISDGPHQHVCLIAELLSLFSLSHLFLPVPILQNETFGSKLICLRAEDGCKNKYC